MVTTFVVSKPRWTVYIATICSDQQSGGDQECDSRAYFADDQDGTSLVLTQASA